MEFIGIFLFIGWRLKINLRINYLHITRVERETDRCVAFGFQKHGIQLKGIAFAWK